MLTLTLEVRITEVGEHFMSELHLTYDCVKFKYFHIEVGEHLASELHLT